MGGEFGGGCRVEKHALRTIKRRSLEKEGEQVCPFLRGVIEAGLLGSRNRYVRVLERVVSRSIIDKGAVLRAISLGIDWTIKCRGVNMG